MKLPTTRLKFHVVVLWLFLHSEILPCQASEWKNSEIHHKTLVGYLVHFQTAVVQEAGFKGS
jgi:hypothetical protein